MAKASEMKPPESGEKVNKSAAIRAILEQDMKTPVKDVVAQLAAKNIDVKEPAVYMVRRQMKLKKRKAARAKSTLEKAASSPTAIDLILKVKTLASQAGGLNNLKELVDALAQ